MKKLTAYVRPDNTVTIICPSCEFVIQLSAAQYRKQAHDPEIECPLCRERTIVSLDFRSYYRKETDLPGTYKVVDPPGGDSGVAEIKNISQTGIGFIAPKWHDLQKDQILELNFHLDNKMNTHLIKRARICSVEEEYIGCAMIHLKEFETELGFYLLP